VTQVRSSPVALAIPDISGGVNPTDSPHLKLYTSAEDPLIWLDMVAPAVNQAIFTEARVFSTKGSFMAVVLDTADGHYWYQYAPVAQNDNTPPPVVLPDPDVTLPPPTTPEPSTPPPLNPGIQSIRGVNAAIWQRSSDMASTAAADGLADPHVVIGQPFVFSGISYDNTTDPGVPDDGIAGTPRDNWFPGGGFNPAVVWDVSKQSSVLLPDRTPYVRDTWNINAVRICTKADAESLSPVNSAEDVIKAAYSMTSHDVIALIATWGHTGKDRSPWEDAKGVDFWTRVLTETSGNMWVWWNFHNEPVTKRTTDSAWTSQAEYWLDMARPHPNPIVLDLGVWGQDLASLADGSMDEWRDRMIEKGVWQENIWMGWHAYGSNQDLGERYTYEAMDSQLNSAISRGWRVLVGEFGETETGRGVPTPFLDGRNRDAVNFLLLGDPPAGREPLAKKYNLPLFPWNGTGDTSYTSGFKLTKGAEFGDHHARPMWQITDANADSLLSAYGQKVWDFYRG